jgi:hypothetical protein
VPNPDPLAAAVGRRTCGCGCVCAEHLDAFDYDIPHLLAAMVGAMDDDATDTLLGALSEVMDSPIDSFGTIDLGGARSAIVAALTAALARLTP